MRHQAWLKFSIIGLLIFSVITYTAWQLRQVVSGPSLTITTPENHSTPSEPLITVTGHADQIDFLYLNGRQIFTDEDGRFSEKLLALAGYNVLELKGKDKFGRQTTEMVEFVINN